MVRYWISLISVSFVMLGALFVGNVAFSMESVDSAESIDNVESLDAESLESLEVKPGQDFTPTAVPTGRIQGIWEQAIRGTMKGQRIEPGITPPKVEEGSQFYPRRLFLGAKGKVLPTVSYLLLGQMQGKTASMLRAHITIDIVDQYLKARLGYMTVPLQKESLTSSRLLFNNGASVWGRGPSAAVMGLILFGSAVNSQLHYYFWVGNVNRQYSNLNNIFSGGFGERYQIGGRIQFDWFRKWKHGEEWLQSKDMNGTIGVSFRYIPAFEDSEPGNALVSDFVGANIDLGFTVSLFYIQAGFILETASAAKEALTKVGINESKSHKLYMGYFVDIAITATSWFVPAIRFEGQGAPISGGINPGSEAVPPTQTGSGGTAPGHTHPVGGSAAVPPSVGPGTINDITPEASKASKMNLLVVLNFYPWSAGHRFKIQPEFIYTIKETDAAGNQVKDAAGKEYNAMSFRVGLMLNF